MAIRIEGFAPLLQVFDMPRSVGFYRDVMGFHVIETSPPRAGRADDFDWGLLRLDGVELMLNTAYEHDVRPGAPDPGRTAVHDDTALFFGCADLDAAYEHLRGCGLDVKPPSVAPYGMRQLWLKDPDGYVICFQCRAG